MYDDDTRSELLWVKAGNPGEKPIIIQEVKSSLCCRENCFGESNSIDFHKSFYQYCKRTNSLPNPFPVNNAGHARIVLLKSNGALYSTSAQKVERWKKLYQKNTTITDINHYEKAFKGHEADKKVMDNDCYVTLKGTCISVLKTVNDAKPFKKDKLNDYLIFTERMGRRISYSTTDTCTQDHSNKKDFEYEDKVIKKPHRKSRLFSLLKKKAKFMRNNESKKKKAREK